MGSAGRDRLGTMWRIGPLLALALGCSEGGEAPDESAAARGERIYKMVCISCHNADPSVDGSVGPAIAGSSPELLEARVIRGVYPPGYRPKRAGTSMPSFPYLAEEIANLEAFLDEAAKR